MEKNQQQKDKENEKLKLFGVLLGGSAPGALVELHDIVFVLAHQIEETYALLKEKWFGDKDSAHIDAWTELETCDGFALEWVKSSSETTPSHSISPDADGPFSTDSPHLYFVNVGSYPPGRMEESHSYVFVVANNKTEAKEKAIQKAPQDHNTPHKDNLFEVDQIQEIKGVDEYILKLKTLPTYLAKKESPIHAEYIPLTKL